MVTPCFVMQRAAVLEGNADQRALGRLGGLPDRFGHFARLAVPKSDPATLIADDDECRKTEAPAALDDLGDAIDVHQPVDELAVAFFALPLFTRHLSILRSKFEAACARGLRQRLDAPVIDIAAPVEHNLLDALGKRALGDLCTHAGRRRDIPRLGRLAFLFVRRRGDDRLTCPVVDDLSVDMPTRAKHGQTRPAGGRAHDPEACTPLAPVEERFPACHGYFFLPSLRRIRSPAYFTPLPL